MVETKVPMLITQQITKAVLPQHAIPATKIQRILDAIIKNPAKDTFYHLIKQKRTFLRISSLAYGILRCTIGTYSAFQNVNLGHENCARRTNYISAILGEKINVDLCVDMNTAGKLVILCSLIFFQVAVAWTAYNYGKYGFRASSYISSKFGTKMKMTPYKQSIVRKVKWIMNPLIFGMISFVLLKIQEGLHSQVGGLNYEHYCLKNMHFRFQNSYLTAAQHYSDISALQNGAGFLTCRQNPWWQSDASMLAVAACFFYIAGLMSIPELK